MGNPPQTDPLFRLLSGSDPSPGSTERVRQSLQAIRNHLGMEVAYISEFVGDQAIFREVDGQRVWDPIASLTAEQVSILDDFRTQVHAHLAAVRLVLLRASRVSPNALCFVGGTLFSLLFAG